MGFRFMRSEDIKLSGMAAATYLGHHQLVTLRTVDSFDFSVTVKRAIAFKTFDTE